VLVAVGVGLVGGTVLVARRATLVSPVNA
jgi:hypothetical protein